MQPAELLELFERVGIAVREALLPVTGEPRRARTSRSGQYAIDLLADAAALRALRGSHVAVVSEESGRSGPSEAAITVVLDPVDGSSNAVRDLPYWSTSLCALDDEGPLAALVVNQATGVTSTATRGGGAWRSGRRLRASNVARIEEAVITLGTWLPRPLPWKQCRVLGSCALELCDVAAGALDGMVAAYDTAAPWDYLGGLLVCREAGAVVRDIAGRSLVVTDGTARRQLVAGATTGLVDALTLGVSG